MSLTRVQPLNKVRGVVLPGHKEATLERPIGEMPMPEQLWLAIEPEHITVAIGTDVQGGQLLGWFHGSAVHAPTSGRVLKIAQRGQCHPSALECPHLVLQVDGLEHWVQRDPWVELPDQPAVLARIAQAGLAGLGGAGFPTAIKLKANGKPLHTLIVNAVECEPYITADHALLRERADAVFRGALLAQQLLGCDRIMIATEDNKLDAIEALQQSSAHSGASVELCVLPTIYPSGSEKQLIEAVLGVQVPAGRFPADIGVLCLNAATLAAMGDAVYDDLPLTRRITTFAGSAVQHPGNYSVPFGTPLEYALDTVGCSPDSVERLIIGGPMMGFALSDLSIPIGKIVNCVIADNSENVPEPEPQQPCIRCGYCVDVCPASLLPQQLYAYAHSNQYERLEQHRIDDCIECGACAWVCPSKIPLVAYYQSAKADMRNQHREKITSDRARERFESHQQRIDLIQQQREEELAERRQKRQGRVEKNLIVQAQKRAEERSTAQLKLALQQAQNRLQELRTSSLGERPDGEVERIEAQIATLQDQLAKYEQ